MNQIEKFTTEKLKHLCPRAEEIEVRAEIGKCSYYFVFWATMDGLKKQCYEMIDNAEYVRNRAGKALPCKLDFVISNN